MSSSVYREDFVLKGGVLLAAFSLRRPTRDIDLQATRIGNDADDVLERLRQIASVDAGDGLIFDSLATTAHPIREDDDYEGVRVRLVSTLGRARLPVGVDVNFGDPIWPGPAEITLPRLVEIGQRPVHILGYPLPWVIAEKTVTALQRGEANTRWRDFGDILAISRTHHVSAGELRAGLEAVATYRRATLRPLLPALSTMPSAVEAKWSNWRRRQAHAQTLPEHFVQALSAIAAFVDPVLGSAVAGDQRWNPTGQTWIPG